MVVGVIEVAAIAVFVAAWAVCIGSWFVGLYHLVRAGAGLLEAFLGFLFKVPPRPEGRFATSIVHREKVGKARKVFFISWLVAMVALCAAAGLAFLTGNLSD